MVSFHLSVSISINFLEKKCEKCLRQYCRYCGKRSKQYFIKLKTSLINSKVLLLLMYLSILFCNVQNNSYIAQWLENFAFIVQLLLIMTHVCKQWIQIKHSICILSLCMRPMHCTNRRKNVNLSTFASNRSKRG